MHSWLLLHYKVPREPTANRVSVWRKLKRLGAVLLHDAIWVLPDTPRTLEQFQWLVAEIGELDGEAWLWQSQLPNHEQEEILVRQFMAQVESAYHTILTELGQPEPNLTALSARYQQALLFDYFHSVLGSQVRDALLTRQGGSD